jgi:8-oxo-dGTP pyrophosphatase MutT (NUDIX family)
MTTDTVAALRAALARNIGGSADFDLDPETVLPPGRTLRPAGVLVAVSLAEGDDLDRARLILTKRSSALKHHPGQIAFAGGKVDPGDADATAAALREAHEEIGLAPDRVEVLGHLPEHETVTGFRIRPVVGVVRGAFVPVAEPGEVAEVFEVPLTHVLDPSHYIVESRRWRGIRRYYFTVPYGPYYIWGATARMLRALAAGMGQ